MAKSGRIPKKYILTIAAFLMAICLFFVAVVGVGLYVVNDIATRFYREVDEFVESIPLGMTMEKVRNIHGDPDSITQPQAPLPSHSERLGPRENDSTTVWFYFLIGRVDYLDGAYLYFNDEGELVRVELIYS